MLAIAEKILEIVVAIIIAVVAFKIVSGKPKANKKTAENTTAPARVSITIEFCGDAITDMEEIMLMTGDRDFKEVVHHALTKYEMTARFKANKNIY